VAVPAEPRHPTPGLPYPSPLSKRQADDTLGTLSVSCPYPLVLVVEPLLLAPSPSTLGARRKG
jgi:hypothetical protein